MSETIREFRGLITAPVGSMHENNPEDVRQVKSRLQDLGYMEKEDDLHGYITRPMDKAIRKFQKEKGLKVDGYLLPGGETEGALAPRGYDEKKYFDKIKNVYRGYADVARSLGFKNAPDYLDRYLDGTGETLQLKPQDARSRSFVREGEAMNRRRFEKSFVDESHSFEKQLKNLQDGETVILKNNHGNPGDFWDYKIGLDQINPKKNPLLKGNMDEFLATGASNFKSKGLFKASRRGDKIYIAGDVDHAWSDEYNFDKGKVYEILGELPKENKAKSFSIRSNWKQGMGAVLDIKDGRLLNPRYYWSDMKE